MFSFIKMDYLQIFTTLRRANSFDLKQLPDGDGDGDGDGNVKYRDRFRPCPHYSVFKRTRFLSHRNSVERFASTLPF